MRRDLLSPDAESALIGDALIDRAIFGLADVSSDDFHDEQFSHIWAVGQHLAARGGYFDSVSIADELERLGRPVLHGVFAQLIADAGDYHVAGEHARIVRDLAERRRALGILQDATRVIHGSNGTWRGDLALRAELLAAHVQPAPAAVVSPLCWAVQAWETRPPRPFVVDGFLGSDDVMVIYGDGGVGKTWIVCDLAVSVADNQPWLGRAVTQSAVLIVDEESGQRRLFDRLERTMRGHGIRPGTDVPIAFASYAGWDLREDADADRLRDLIAQTSAGLVIIDALMDTMLGAEENSVKDAAQVFHNLRSVSQATGSAIVVLHHANKAGGYRGSTAIKGSIESLVSVSKLNEAGTLLRVESDKLRDGEPFSFGARLAFDGQTNSFRLNLAEVREKGQTFSAAEKYVIHTLQAAGAAGANMSAITGAADSCSSESARRAVYVLVQRGFVERIDGGGSGKVPGVWAIVEGNPINI